jgi:hypothetical protein
MLNENDWSDKEEEENLSEEESIDRALLQMDILCRSRCVQAPTSPNVTVREIEKK